MSDNDPPILPTADEIRREREARGWSQAELARRAGVGARTIVRLESATNEAAMPRSLPAVQRVLGLGDYRPDEIGDALRIATASQLAAEIVRRLGEHEQWAAERDTRASHEGHRPVAHDRIRTGPLPEGVADKPGVILGPVTDTGDDAAGSDA